MLLQVMPTGAQHSAALLARYGEATPNVPGSGMARPRHDLGTVEIVALLRLDAAACASFGLLGAYALTSPPGAVDDAADDEADGAEPEPAGAEAAAEADAEARLQPAVLKLNVLRLQRCLGRPCLLQARVA